MYCENWTELWPVSSAFSRAGCAVQYSTAQFGCTVCSTVLQHYSTVHFGCTMYSTVQLGFNGSRFDFPSPCTHVVYGPVYSGVQSNCTQLYSGVVYIVHGVRLCSTQYTETWSADKSGQQTKVYCTVQWPSVRPVLGDLPAEWTIRTAWSFFNLEMGGWYIPLHMGRGRTILLSPEYWNMDPFWLFGMIWTQF